MTVFELEDQLRLEGYELVWQGSGVYRNTYNIQGFPEIPEIAVYTSGNHCLRVWRKGYKEKVISVELIQ